MAGRPKGSRNQATIKWIEAAREGRITPVEYMLEVMRDETNDLEVRMDAAKAAAPYIHPRLLAAAVNADVNFTTEETERLELPRVCQIIEELVASTIEGDAETLSKDVLALPDPVHEVG